MLSADKMVSDKASPSLLLSLTPVLPTFDASSSPPGHNNISIASLSPNSSDRGNSPTPQINLIHANTHTQRLGGLEDSGTTGNSELPSLLTASVELSDRPEWRVAPPRCSVMDGSHYKKRQSVSNVIVRGGLQKSASGSWSDSPDTKNLYRKVSFQIRRIVEDSPVVSQFFSFHKRIASYARKINKSNAFQAVMFAALISALFLPDLWVVIDRPDNGDLDMFLTFVLFLFLLELIVQSIGYTRSYLGSFFFWMDLVGAASLLLDLSYLPFFELAQKLGSGDDTSMDDNVLILRIARLAKLGARAGRFTKVVKFLRFLPGMGGFEDHSGQASAKVISSRLLFALATRVACLIIVTVLILPFFWMFSFPAKDWSEASWMSILEDTGLRHPDRLDEQLARMESFYEPKDHFPYRIRIMLPDFLQVQELVVSSRGGPRRRWNEFRMEQRKNETHYISFDINFTGPQKTDAVANMILILMIMIAMVGFSLWLSDSVRKIVLKPLESLLSQVKGVSSTILKSVNDMTVSMAVMDEDASQMGRRDSDQDEDERAYGFDMETLRLEMVLKKVVALSEITMNKSTFDEEQMAELEEKDFKVIDAWTESRDNTFLFGHRLSESDLGEVDMDALRSQHMGVLRNAGLSLELIDSWQFCPLELDKARNRASVTYFFSPITHSVKFDNVVLGFFLEEIENEYGALPYHNWFHAVDVTHCVYRLLQIMSGDAFLSNIDRYALLISAIAHDAGHPGVNNLFLVETTHELALRYNDKSPLENMHCAKLFSIASSARTNVFASLSKKEFQEARRMCIDMILYTDNSRHFDIIKEVQMMVEVNSDLFATSRELYHSDHDDFPQEEVVELLRQHDGRSLLRKLFLHIADLSNSMKPFRISRLWAGKCLDEFFKQGDTEKELMVPVQSLNDREKVNRPTSQIGFIEFLVAPLAHPTAKLLPPFETLVEQLINNAGQWHEVFLHETKPPPSDDEQKSLNDRMAKLDARYLDFTK